MGVATSRGVWVMSRREPRRQRDAMRLDQEPPTREHWLPVGRERLPLKTIAVVGPSAASLAVAAGPMIDEICSRGNHVVCFAPELDDASERTFAGLRAEFRELPGFRQGFSPLADQRSVYRLARAFRDIRPDVVAAYSPKGAVLAGLAGRLAGVKRNVAMISELGRAFVEAPDRASASARQMQRSLLRLALRVSDTAVFFNEENYKILHRHGMLPPRLRQFPMNSSGIDLRHFPAAPLPPLDRGVMFLFAGPLDRRLGIAEYCEAARILQAKPGNYKCLVAGPEIKGASAFPLAELKRYRDVVQYLGPQADPRPYMARTHVFVLPARGDAIPHSLIEAIAMGRPVITSTSRGCRVVVREAGNGLLVRAGDAAALAGAMARLLQRPDLIPSMARASRQLAESQFDSRRINALLLSALDL
jgi:glycosyltransferase involved in cell wall biosynthesis